MRTEIVKIIESLINHDAVKTSAYYCHLKKNFDDGKVHERDKLFVKRILALIFEEYRSENISVLDNEGGG